MSHSPTEGLGSVTRTARGFELLDRKRSKADDKAYDLYARLASLSKSLEGSGRIDEHDNPDAYATVLDAMKFVMNFVRAAGPSAHEPRPD